MRQQIHYRSLDNGGERLLRLTLTARESRFFSFGVIGLATILFIVVYGHRAVVRNVLNNPGFELGTNGWYPHDRFGVIDASTESPHSGRQAVICTKRNADWAGPEQSVLKRMQPGKTYICSGWVRLQNGDEDPVKMTIRQRDGKGSVYHNLSSISASPNRWRFFSGRFDFKAAGQVQELVLFFEGPRRGVDLLVDDVKIVPDRFLLLLWPVGSLVGLLGAGAMLGLVTRRPRSVAGCGIAAVVLGIALFASWLGDHRSAVVGGSAPDFVKMFEQLGFEKVVRGTLLDIKQDTQEPTLYIGTGVQIYGNCSSNLAIIAKNAQIYGRVQGKVYFRGQKLTIQPSADLWGGIDASGQVVNKGTIRTLEPERTSASLASQEKGPADSAMLAARLRVEPSNSTGASDMFLAHEILTNSTAQRQDGPASNEVGRLTYVETIRGPGLNGVFGLTLSTNNQYLYAASLDANAIMVYRRDLPSGHLSPVQVLRNGLNGAIGIRLSPDQRYAVAIAYRSQAVILYKRDLESGQLEPLHVLKQGDGVHGLSWMPRVRFSPDARQVYVLDGATGGITTLACDPDRGLQWLETVRNQHTRGSRCLEVLPDGRTIVVANLNTHTLTVFARDPTTGRLSLRQALPNGQDGVEQTKGQFGVTGSPDGKFIYVCSGLFGGDQSIAIFRVTNQGTLEQVQAFVNGQDDLVFSGGRDAIVSPDGRNLYAMAKPSTLACFARDLLTGKIRLIEFFVSDPNELKGPTPECSPDGRFVYVPGHSGISIYRRELAR